MKRLKHLHRTTRIFDRTIYKASWDERHAFDEEKPTDMADGVDTIYWKMWLSIPYGISLNIVFATVYSHILAYVYVNVFSTKMIVANDVQNSFSNERRHHSVCLYISLLMFCLTKYYTVITSQQVFLWLMGCSIAAHWRRWCTYVTSI